MTRRVLPLGTVLSVGFGVASTRTMRTFLRVRCTPASRPRARARTSASAPACASPKKRKRAKRKKTKTKTQTAGSARPAQRSINRVKDAAAQQENPMHAAITPRSDSSGGVCGLRGRNPQYGGCNRPFCPWVSAWQQREQCEPFSVYGERQQRALEREHEHRLRN